MCSRSLQVHRAAFIVEVGLVIRKTPYWGKSSSEMYFGSVLAIFGGLGEKKLPDIPTWYYIIAPRKRNVAQSRVHHSVH